MNSKKICPNCFSKDFLYLGRSAWKVQIYCSLACRKEFYLKKYRFKRELLGKSNKKNCVECGQKYLSKVNQKTCSPSCSLKLRRQSARKAAEKYQEIKKIKKDKPVSFDVKEKLIGHCLNCTKEIPFGKKKTCSLTCRRKRDYQTHKKIRQQRSLSQNQPLFRNCVECGKQFKRYKTKITCSLPCWIANRDKKAAISRRARLGIKYFNCTVCAKEFKREGGEKVCSSECRKQAKKIQQKKWYKDKATCRHCHKVFKKKSNDALCSSECKKKYRREKYARTKKLTEKKISRELAKFFNCKFCKKQFKRGSSETTCSLECRIKWRRLSQSKRRYELKGKRKLSHTHTHTTNIKNKE